MPVAGFDHRRSVEHRLNFSATVGWMVGTLFGATLTPVLLAHGLRRVGRNVPFDPYVCWAGALLGCTAGAAAIGASIQAGTWWLAAALIVWACALVAAAACDAITQRVPTSLVRSCGAITGALLIAGSTLHDDWHGLILSGVAALGAGAALWLCWRLAGAGFGDVRLATLGGLGLGHGTVRGLVVGAVACCALLVVQAAVTSVRNGDRHARLPLGPALALGFLMGAVV